jgi:hypothetical protein
MAAYFYSLQMLLSIEVGAAIGDALANEDNQ